MERLERKNEQLKGLIQELKKKAIEKDTLLFKRIAVDLEKSTRKRRIVNLNRINMFTKDNEIVVVPGKVLGSGDLDHKVTIAAYQFSSSALDKINNSKSKAISIKELMKDETKGKRIKLIG